MTHDMTPGGKENRRFAMQVATEIAQMHNKALAPYLRADEIGVAAGWFIAVLFSVAINLGKRGGLNHTNLRAVFETYLEADADDDNKEATTLDPATLINKPD